VLVHARAGQAAARRHGADHVIAGDVIEAIPEAMRELRGEEAHGRLTRA
jgi:NAD(P)H-hydrate repair Nnr-like enzyme with NAD(P)H-hydrate dehydratase domain